MQINIINLFQGKHCLAGEMIQTGKKMKESWSETLWNEQSRRLGKQGWDGMDT